MDELRWILLGVAIVVVVAIYFFSRTRNREQPPSPLEAANEMPAFSAKDEAAKGEWVDGVGPVRVVEKFDQHTIETVESLSRSLKEDPLVAEEKQAPDNSVQPGNKVGAEPTPEPEAPAQPLNTEPEAAAEINDEPQPLDPAEDEYEDEEVGHQEAAIDDVIAVYVLASDEEPTIKGEKILSASYALNLEHGEMKIFHRHSDDADRKILFSAANIQEPGWFDVESMHQLETKGISFFMQVNLVDDPSRVLDDMLICAHGMSTMLGAKLCNPHKQLLDEAYTNSLRDKVKKLATLKSQAI